MADRGLQFVSFEGKGTSRAALRAARVEPAAPCSTEPRVSAEPDAGLARRTLAGCGLDADAYRVQPLLRRVQACLRALDARTATDARALVDQRPEARARALGSFLISVTGFFRDAAIFDQVERVVIPSLAARVGPLRVWSAGCADGSELYSFAMLLAEAGVLARSELLGTDCRLEAVQQAGEAVFDAPAVEALAAGRLTRFFEPVGVGKWKAAAALRAHAAWKRADITRDVERGPWDVILWRNVAIYLRSEASGSIARRLVAALAPGGFLVLGRAERLPPGLGVRRVGRSLYQRMEHAGVA